MTTYTMYIDILEGLDPAQYGLCATTRPTKKMKNSKRISFEVTIPEELLYEVDGNAAHVTRPKILAV